MDRELLRVSKAILESLNDLYKAEPRIAGEYFGACLTDRFENAIKNAEKAV